ncbi:MAG: adenylate/guanylate cyclase domain-containing protein, partial [Bacteroidota bacterium]
TDEPAALSALQKFKTALESKVTDHQGRIIQFYGDGCLATFESSVNAVNCAQALQLDFQAAPKVPVRIGLHAGDVIYRESNVFGDAVNIASRVESMGIPGSVLLSSNVRNQIKNKPHFELVHLGKFEFKNVEEGMTYMLCKRIN